MCCSVGLCDGRYCNRDPGEADMMTQFDLLTLLSFRSPMASVFHSAPTAREIKSTTIESEMKTWIMARIFAQRASSGASVGPKVEL